jgi:hypothetical protein
LLLLVGSRVDRVGVGIVGIVGRVARNDAAAAFQIRPGLVFTKAQSVHVRVGGAVRLGLLSLKFSFCLFFYRIKNYNIYFFYK